MRTDVKRRINFPYGLRCHDYAYLHRILLFNGCTCSILNHVGSAINIVIEDRNTFVKQNYEEKKINKRNGGIGNLIATN